MKLGIGSWTFPWAIGFQGYPPPEKPMDAVALLHKAKSLGVEVVQICDNIDLSEMSRAELISIRDKAGEMDLILQTGTRGAEPELLRRYLNISLVLNSRLLRIITDRGDSKPDAKQVVVGIKSVLPDFAGAGVSIAIENHDRFRTWELVGIIEEIGSPNVGICLDTVNSFGALECPGQIVTFLGPYALNVHVKDFTINRIRNGMGFTILGRPAGQGMLDIDMVLRKLAEGGRNPDVVLEQWTPFDSTIEKTVAMEDEWAKIGIAYLKEKIRSMKEDA